MNQPDGHLPSPEVIDIVHTLIGFDTTSRLSNLGLIEWTRDRLRRHGVKTHLTYDEGGGKANLFATIGDERDGGLILSGHTDVVPVDGQDWSTDPFKATIKDDKIFGRGTCDMKGFIACALAAVPRMQAAGGERPFHLALTYDEEVGCIGVRDLLADLHAQGIRPAACLVGEPTQMSVVTGHKGRRELRCCVRGREAHSSLPLNGLSAIEYGAQIIAWLKHLADREAIDGRRMPGFDIPYSTLNCGTIQGGIAPNVIPRDCEFSVELRYLPGDDGTRLLDELRKYVDQRVLPEMKAKCPEAHIEWKLINDTPGLMVDEEGWLVSAVGHVLSAASGHAPKLQRLAFSTEAGLFSDAGIPALLCGPGSLDQAHRPDEFIEISQLAACERFLHGLVDRFQHGSIPHQS